ncbi:invasion associated locus B family protein [Asaia bogorensis]|uniref:invasion associated locus B family protein n=1 Tax=Asaia bogorensis TaxID=91915 RepID=UPI002864D807|nr:invasion associated locus B family protein [Asaia bogorensis]MDR6182132.1 invasion protein IalB [Asaia bogorensis NBRC 16594]
MKRSIARLSLLSVFAGVFAAAPCFAGVEKETSPASPAASPATVSGSVGDWTYRCIYPAGSLNGAPNICSVEQRLFKQDADKKDVPIGGVILAKATPDAAKMPIASRPWRLTLMTPLGLSLVKPSHLIADSNPPLTLVWQSCIATGCLSVLELNDQQVRVLRHGKEGHMQISKLLDGVLTINFALNGLDGALSATERLMAQPSAH